MSSVCAITPAHRASDERTRNPPSSANTKTLATSIIGPATPIRLMIGPSSTSRKCPES